MKLINIRMSYKVAKHYGFAYMWKYVWKNLPHSSSAVIEGGLIDDSTGQLGSIPIALDPMPSNDGVYTAVVE